MISAATLMNWTQSGLLLGAEPSMGRWVFVAALGLVLIWLIFMPARLIGQADGAPPWWRNVRFWAIVVCVIQMWIYWQFG